MVESLQFGSWRGGSAPRLPGAVEVAPGVLRPARAGPHPSGGLARRWRALVCRPAAERSRDPPSVPQGGEGGEGAGPGPPHQKRWPAPGTPSWLFRRSLAVALRPWRGHRVWNKS